MIQKLSLYLSILVFAGCTFSKVTADSDKTINLARTSLALVSASSCNGDRPLSNKFYGILNAFDGGENIVNKINYPYWLGNCNQEEWIEVEFSCPVSVESLLLEGSTQCNVTLSFENGEEKVFKKIVDIVELDKINPISSRPGYAYTDSIITPTTNNRTIKFDGAMNGVKKVRLTFSANNPQLGELKIVGPAPDCKTYKVGKPRLKVTKKDSLLEGNDVYKLWVDKTFGVQAVEADVTETKESFIYIYRKDDKQLLKVIVNKKNGLGKIDDKNNGNVSKTKPVYSYYAVIWESGEQKELSKSGTSEEAGIASNFLGEVVSITVEGKRPGNSRITGALTVSGKQDSKCFLPIRKWEEKEKNIYAICEPRVSTPLSVVSISTEEKVMTDKILGELISKFIPENK